MFIVGESHVFVYFINILSRSNMSSAAIFVLAAALLALMIILSVVVIGRVVEILEIIAIRSFSLIAGRKVALFAFK